MTTPHVISLDPATSFGWAVMTAAGGRVESGVWLLKRPKDPSHVRWVTLRRELLALLQRYPGVRWLAYEHVRRHRGVQAAHVYGGCLAMVQECASIAGVALVPVEVAAVKRAATGKGNAKKAAMVEAALVRWPALAASTKDDEADALWVGVAAIQQLTDEAGI